jgi:hypothetical protein
LGILFQQFPLGNVGLAGAALKLIGVDDDLHAVVLQLPKRVFRMV